MDTAEITPVQISSELFSSSSPAEELIYLRRFSRSGQQQTATAHLGYSVHMFDLTCDKVIAVLGSDVETFLPLCGGTPERLARSGILSLGCERPLQRAAGKYPAGK